jgi:hypothetical protein
MNAPRSALGKSNKQGKIMRWIFNSKMRSLKIPVKQPLFFTESFERFLA